MYGLEPPTTAPVTPTTGHGTPGGSNHTSRTGLAGPVSEPTEHGNVSPAFAGLEALANWLAPHGRAEKNVTVPNVRGIRASDAFYAVARADLEINFVRLTENPTGGDGTVVDQDPPPGATVRRHSQLTVHVVHPKPDAGITLS